MESILNVEVSRFNCYRSPDAPTVINLLAWLQADEYRAEVERIRSIADKAERDKEKAKLPAITPSAVVPYRNSESGPVHTGFIQFDIDLKDNPHIANFAHLKQELAKIKNVAYCGLSVSGMGYWGLIPVAHPDKHEQHFKTLFKALSNFGIKLDPSPKSIVSLRGYSYDPDAYFNHQATPLKKYEAPVQRPRKKQTTNPTQDQMKVEACLREIERKEVDITSFEPDWFSIGCDFASSFGEVGRDYFHTVSANYPKYDQVKTDRKFDSCVKKVVGADPSLATFFARCKANGILFKDLEQTASEAAAPAYAPAPKPQPPAPAEEPAPVAEPIKYVRPDYSRPEPEQKVKWDNEIQELQEYFSKASLPGAPVRLNAWSMITDPASFVDSHLATVTRNNGKRAFRPFLDRLEEFKSVLSKS